MTRRIIIPAVVALAAALAAARAGAQEAPVRWKLQPVAQVTAGQPAKVIVSATIDAGWHVYGLTQPRPPIALTFAMTPSAIVTTGKPIQPKPIHRYDAAFDIETEFFEKTAAFTVPFTVAAGTKPGNQELAVLVKFQACTERICLPPYTETLSFTTKVMRGAAAAPPVKTSATVTPPPPIENAAPPAAVTPAALLERPQAFQSEAGKQRGLGRFLLFAALMGAFALATPCVFPMIPITVSYFTKRGAASAGQVVRLDNVRDAAVYGGGIVLAFSGLGLLLAFIYGATGINRFAANPWVNLLVAALFIGFALDLLGVWEMRLPWQLMTKVNEQSNRGGLPGLLFMGVAFAVTTFTCTVPLVGTLLVTAASGEWIRPVLGMLAFSGMFALPFVVLALFPSLLHALPASGSWMGSFKVVLGLIELAAAFKFLSNADLVWHLGVLPRPVVLVIWIALAIITSLYLLGLMRRPRTVRHAGPARMISSGAFVALALFMAPGLFGRSVGELDAFLPPRIYPGTVAGQNEKYVWLTDYEQARAKAKATQRPIFVDFTGYTCTNCRWMETHVFNRPDIERRFDGFVLLRLYTDGSGDEYTQNQAMQLTRFKTVALPFYAILTSDGRATATFPGLTRNHAEFAAFLDTGLNN